MTDDERRFASGDVVRLTRNNVEAVIAWEDPEDQLQCPLHDDKRICWEWANVLGVDGKWRWHVGECVMDVTEWTKDRYGR